MKLTNLAKISFAAVFGGAILFGTNIDANAQGNSRWAHEKNRIRKEQKAHEKAEKRAAKRYYRLYRGDRYYQTDNRGYDLLRSAVNRGYQQGYRAGVNDRRYRRSMGYNDESFYRSGTYGYQTYVDRSQYQHYFRQGFERGYQDGFYDQSRYGSNSGGTWNILGSILGSILNVREF